MVKNRHYTHLACAGHLSEIAYNSYAASLRPFRYTQKMAKPNLQLRLVQGGCGCGPQDR
jgi:hypothetical protein